MKKENKKVLLLNMEKKKYKIVRDIFKEEADLDENDENLNENDLLLKNDEENE